jgi:hypothetical protein
MPAAAPLPGSPSVVTVYTAADLLTGPGCPVCRYAGEASERYFAWFALEAHAQSPAITRLSGALGMCPRHTRRLMSQPGAAARLTVVYRYVVEAARGQLVGRIRRRAPCPACEHDGGTERRVLDTLVDGLTDASVRERYRELGGLCIPHLRMAVPQARGGLAVWLTDAMMAAVDTPSPGLRWLAGTDHDAEIRAELRTAIPASQQPGAEVCVACLAAARSEIQHLAHSLHHGRDRREDRLLVCASHLSDLAVLAGRGGTGPLLAWQAGCLATGPAKHPAAPPAWQAGHRRGWPRPPRRSGTSPGTCPVCAACRQAAGQRLGDFRGLPRTGEPQPRCRAALCVRHILELRALDPQAAQNTVPGAAGHADMLIDELNEAFRKSMHAHRHRPPGREMTAWRRAAAFLDGSVFCGCPPPDAGGPV